MITSNRVDRVRVSHGNNARWNSAPKAPAGRFLSSIVFCSLGNLIQCYLYQSPYLRGNRAIFLKSYLPDNRIH